MCVYWSFEMVGFLFSVLYLFSVTFEAELLNITIIVCVHNVCVNVCVTLCLWRSGDRLGHQSSSFTFTWLSERTQITRFLQEAHLPAKHTLGRCFALFLPCNFDNVGYFCYCIIIAVLGFFKQIAEQNLLDL